MYVYEKLQIFLLLFQNAVGSLLARVIMYIVPINIMDSSEIIGLIVAGFILFLYFWQVVLHGSRK